MTGSCSGGSGGSVMGSGRVAELREYVRAWRWGLRARLIPAGPPHLPYPPRSALTLPLSLLLLLRLLPSQPQHTQKIPPLTTYRTVSPWVIPVVLYPHLVTLPTSLAPPPHTLPGCPHYWFLTRRSFNPCEGSSHRVLSHVMLPLRPYQSTCSYVNFPSNAGASLPIPLTYSYTLALSTSLAARFLFL